ncbi:MAG: tRNA pseudouridine(55) synthase TruB [Minisyncoccia bacterium]
MILNPGIYAFYKPKGISSYDLIRKIKKITPKNKIGHSGTLDPLASGVLVVAIGRQFTKRLSLINKESKEYIAQIYLGVKSSTDDEAGEKTKVKIKIQPDLKTIKNCLKNFIGEIYQTPPLFSAVKIKGKPAYWYARQKLKINLKPKKVIIYDIKILKYNWPILKIKVNCSSGTYIRSLARDIGQTLGCGAYLKDLIRTKVDGFTLKDCIKLN